MPGKVALDKRVRYGQYWLYATKKEANQAGVSPRPRKNGGSPKVVAREMQCAGTLSLSRSKPRRGRSTSVWTP